ncbi:Hypothetical_protein [Hexamita inflata]|uniref:Hypothetical_protein n=1 Tax=Hexamita inflata TaxID=28002 RepID=A0AA86RHE9_9EUKA|nr:Hypothetical protein HINF_LOCUS65721 [Hexamita inflata]
MKRIPNILHKIRNSPSVSDSANCNSFNQANYFYLDNCYDEFHTNLLYNNSTDFITLQEAACIKMKIEYKNAELKTLIMQASYISECQLRINENIEIMRRNASKLIGSAIFQ